MKFGPNGCTIASVAYLPVPKPWAGFLTLSVQRGLQSYLQKASCPVGPSGFLPRLYKDAARSGGPLRERTVYVLLHKKFGAVLAVKEHSLYKVTIQIFKPNSCVIRDQTWKWLDIQLRSGSTHVTHYRSQVTSQKVENHMAFCTF